MLRASVVFTLCPPGLSSFFCYTHTQPAEPNLPAHVFTTQQSLCRSRGGFSGVGGEFTEAFSRSLPREPFLGRIWNIGSSRRPVFSNELYGTVGQRERFRGDDGSRSPNARISLTETRVRLCCCFSFGPREVFGRFSFNSPFPSHPPPLPRSFISEKRLHDLKKEKQETRCRRLLDIGNGNWEREKKNMILLNESFYLLKRNFSIGKWEKLEGQRVQDRSTQA